MTATAEEPFDYVPATPDRYPDMCSMFKRAFGKDIDAGYTSWKYQQNPEGAMLGILAYSGSSPAAYFGTIPYPVWVNGKAETWHQVMDIMTDPDFQRRGLFAHTGKRHLAALAAEHPGFVAYGIPAGILAPSYVSKLNFRSGFHFPLYFTHRQLFSLSNAFSSKLKCEVAALTDDIPGSPAFFQALQPPPAQVSVRFSEAMFRWKYLQNKMYRYQVYGVYTGGALAALAAIKEAAPGQYLVDTLLALPQYQAGGQLYRALFAHLYSVLPARYFFGWRSSNSELDKALAGAGFVRNPLKHKGPFRHFARYVVYTDLPGWQQHGLQLDAERSYAIQASFQD